LEIRGDDEKDGLFRGESYNTNFLVGGKREKDKIRNFLWGGRGRREKKEEDKVYCSGKKIGARGFTKLHPRHKKGAGLFF